MRNGFVFHAWIGILQEEVKPHLWRWHTVARSDMDCVIPGPSCAIQGQGCYELKDAGKAISAALSATCDVLCLQLETTNSQLLTPFPAAK